MVTKKTDEEIVIEIPRGYAPEGVRVEITPASKKSVKEITIELPENYTLADVRAAITTEIVEQLQAAHNLNDSTPLHANVIPSPPINPSGTI
jgi:hypothetical protein